jgi:hypothetical protein
MLAHVDKNGVYYSDPILIKNTVFPWRGNISSAQILKYILEMKELGLIALFEDNGSYLYYPDFKEKQPYLRPDKELTDFPEPPIPDSDGKQSVKSTSQSKIKESKVKEPYVPSEEATRLVKHLRLEILANNPDAIIKEDGWYKVADLMLSKDNRTCDDVYDVITWCQKDDFWFKNILSMGKLRKQYDALYVKMKGKPKAKPKSILDGAVNRQDDNPPN